MVCLFVCLLKLISRRIAAHCKKCHNTLPVQIQRQTIKVQYISYQNAALSILISVAFFFDVYHIPYIYRQGLNDLSRRADFARNYGRVM